MEDRYLFKAKRIDNGEWICGDLIKTLGSNRSWISSEDVDEARLRLISWNCAEWRAYEVDTDTICQCTGLKDKNVKMIWDNDIVNTQYGKAIVVWDKSEWRIKWIDDVVWRKDLHFWVTENTYGVEVIGNKFDNPDLISQN